MKTLPVTYSIQQHIMVVGFVLIALVMLASCKPSTDLSPTSFAWGRCIDANHDWRDGDPYCDDVAKNYQM